MNGDVEGEYYRNAVCAVVEGEVRGPEEVRE
jgi:hypothetical protein